jgi:hypothetical protein
MPSGFAHRPPGAILPGFAGWKPSGIPAATDFDRVALVSSSFPSLLSLGGCLAPPVMFANPKGIPVDERDFLEGKGYPSAAFIQVIKLV